MKQYLDAIQDVLNTGQHSSNRTGTDTLFKHGLYMTFDLASGFPLLTTKKMNWQSSFAEMLGFWRGLDSAEDFAELGTNVWNANAKAWRHNPHCRHDGDLGRIYGVQAREWAMTHKLFSSPCSWTLRPIDQLAKVYKHLRAGVDDRREIVTHWNPGELEEMALPPCHLFYQFGLTNVAGDSTASALDLFVYIRSNDMGLGMPFNIAGYAWLLSVMSQITNKVPGTLHYFAWNYHIYVNHIEALVEQLEREPRKLPELSIDPMIRTLKDMDTWVTTDAFNVTGYDPHPAIKMKMAV